MHSSTYPKKVEHIYEYKGNILPGNTVYSLIKSNSSNSNNGNTPTSRRRRAPPRRKQTQPIRKKKKSKPVRSYWV